MTARDGRFTTDVNETISASASSAKPNSMVAIAASVA